MGNDKGLDFEGYYNKYYQQVYLYILKKVGNVALAEDLTMDAFYSCYKNYASFDETKASFGTWIYVIVNNKLKNYYRDKKEFDDVDEVEKGDSGFEDEIVEAEYLTGMRKELALALKSLNPIERSIVVGKYFKELNSNEIAAENAMTPGNVRVILHRAINKMKTYFDNKNIKWEM